MSVIHQSRPIIVSASRRTDIPAFYAGWFIDRIKEGYLMTRNPFNNQACFVSFTDTRLIVFWTKNPEPLITYLPVLDRLNLDYYFHFTLNDYESEKYEARLPSVKDRIRSFIRLSSLIGKDKMVWRFDPLILSEHTGIGELLRRLESLGNHLATHTNRLVISFVDVMRYKKVHANLLREGYFDVGSIAGAEFTTGEKMELAGGLGAMLGKWKKMNPDFEVATCCEDVDLESHGIIHNKCIDDNLILKVFKQNEKLINYIRQGREKSRGGIWRDKGQRKNCLCIPSKDIGLYDTCPHLCAYCYANTSSGAIKSLSGGEEPM
jgi:DNA repair photolyase